MKSLKFITLFSIIIISLAGCEAPNSMFARTTTPTDFPMQGEMKMPTIDDSAVLRIEEASTLAARPASTPDAEAEFRIVTIGDSLTKGVGDEMDQGGYTGRLLDQVRFFRPAATLANLGVPGATSADLITGTSSLPSQVDRALKLEPDIICLWIGVNDIWQLYSGLPAQEDWDEAEESTTTQYRANIEKILQTLKPTGAKVYIGLLHDISRNPDMQWNDPASGELAARISQRTMLYNSIIVDEAAKFDAVPIDLSNLSLFADPAYLAPDGHHPNAAGYDIIYSVWMDAIRLVFH